MEGGGLEKKGAVVSRRRPNSQIRCSLASAQATVGLLKKKTKNFRAGGRGIHEKKRTNEA